MNILKRLKHIKYFEHLCQSPAGRLLLGGLALGFAYCLFLFVFLFIKPLQAQHLWAMTVTHIMFGRAAGISYGYTMALSTAWVVFANMVIESVIVMLVFPFFVFGLNKLNRFEFLHRNLRKIEIAAYKNKKFIKRYGLIGLFAFVCFPFWMTGPLVGAFIGHLMRLNIRLNIAIVLSGTFMAIIAWSFVLFNVTEKITEFSVLAPFFMLMILVAIAITANFIDGADDKEKNKTPLS